jgi:hypothetical protein
MKGDFSRQTWDPRKHYSGVLMQQGRVQSDADWNEQDAIHRRRTQIETRDVIGLAGGPEDNAGFGISVSGEQLRIGAGRYYVDGLLCENETVDLSQNAQPDMPGVPPWIEFLTKAKATSALVYLDVWERHITALDDPRLREVALGGPDTATRVKTVWQVRLLPVSQPADTVAALKAHQKKRATAQKKLDELKTAGGNAQDIVALEAEIAALDALIAELSAGPTCGSSFKEWDDLVADPERRLNARTRPVSGVAGPCVVPPTAGYRRLENQLYRVEIHTPGAPGVATFKWSRDNGTVVTAVEKISGKEVTVHDLGPDDVLGFASGQWVELGDDLSELEGRPGQLCQIDAVNSSLRRVTLKTAPVPLSPAADGVDPSFHPKLRRWDQAGNSATQDGAAMSAGWLELEDGVEVQFTGSAFRTGDYWLVPARTASGDIEWPPYAVPNASPEPQLRRGIEHHLCRLALLGTDPATGIWHVSEDCRALFAPITEPCCDAAALHIVSTNWVNDDGFSAATFVRDGLRIRLDARPDPLSLTNDSVQVMIEAPYAQGDNTPSTTLTQLLSVRGVVSRDPTDDRTIVWRIQPTTPAPVTTVPPTAPPTVPTAPPAAPTTGPVVAPTVTVVPSRGFHELLRSAAVDGARVVAAGNETRGTAGRKAARASATAAVPTRSERAAATAVTVSSLRLRVTVKGRTVWSDPKSGGPKRRFLDGQVFGEPALRADTTTPRTGLTFPTGHGAVASDFESWFYYGGRDARESLKISTIRFLDGNRRSSSAGDITPPVAAGQKVGFKAGEGIFFVQVTFNRAITEASLGSANAPAMFIERLSAAGAPVRVGGVVGLESPTVALFSGRGTFDNGTYALTVLGTAAGGAPAVTAADDQSALDGNYDNQSGGDLTLTFTAA